MKKSVLLISMIFILMCGVAFAQTTEFTYQGSLKNGASPASGNYDFEFALFDAGSLRQAILDAGPGGTTGGTGFIASDLQNVNPQLGGFANNGGATYTYSLLPTSPAINGGNNSGAPATDQRGVARPQGAAVDIGSFESGVIPRIFGKFVFVRAGEIFSINPNGSNELQLTSAIHARHNCAGSCYFLGD